LRTIYRFAITRPNSLDPLEVIADATRQAQAEGLAREAINPGSPDSLSCHYEVDGTTAVLVVEGTEEAPVADIAGLMNTRYGHPEPKVEEVTEEISRFDSEISSNPERSAS
jgi:hypothetical protein